MIATGAESRPVLEHAGRSRPPIWFAAVSGICNGRIVIITGSGRGIGRAHALAFAREGARVVVNDLGVAADGTGGDHSPAQQVVEEIVGLGGEAVADAHDIADWEGARALVATAVDA